MTYSARDIIKLHFSLEKPNPKINSYEDFCGSKFDIEIHRSDLTYMNWRGILCEILISTGY